MQSPFCCLVSPGRPQQPATGPSPSTPTASPAGEAFPLLSEYWKPSACISPSTLSFLPVTERRGGRRESGDEAWQGGSGNAWGSPARERSPATRRSTDDSPVRLLVIGDCSGEKRKGFVRRRPVVRRAAIYGDGGQTRRQDPRAEQADQAAEPRSVKTLFACVIGWRRDRVINFI